jgi:hypothetical protein
MVLAKDVPGMDGGVYLPAGATLDATAIDGLKVLGLPDAAINFPAGQPDKDTERAWLAAYVRNFFLFVDADSPHLENLFRCCVGPRRARPGRRLENALRVRAARPPAVPRPPTPPSASTSSPATTAPPRTSSDMRPAWRASPTSPSASRKPLTRPPARPTTSPASWPPTSA